MRRLVAAGLVAALVVLAGYWVLNRSGDAPSAGPVRMEHIHGLGVDPADGVLYAGTHYGLFRVADGEAVRVADRVQDFMGFTVAGPGRFLASGHPGAGQPGPGAVGLLESDDRGESWQVRSLAGEADFHSLAYRHDRAYGLNAMTGELLVSTDLESWESLTRVPIADFAVDPSDPATLVATTEEGPALSTDTGTTFRLLDGGPLVVLVDWADDGTIVAVAPDGAVHTSAGVEGPWTARGSLDGPPEALLAVSGSEIYAAARGRIVHSTDGGDTFRPVI